MYVYITSSVCALNSDFKLYNAYKQEQDSAKW